MLIVVQASAVVGFNWARVEDWLLAGWMAIATPLLARSMGGAGPFDSGHPIDGALDLVAVVGALGCLVTTSSDRAANDGPDILDRAAIGPLVGGMLFVAIAGFSGVGLSDLAAKAVVVVALVAIVVLRIRWPKLPTRVRRGLVTPFTLVAGSLFATFINPLTGGSLLPDGFKVADLGTYGLAIGFFVLFSAVFYTMLVYAPRQVADREGGPVTWIVRFALFAVATVVGIGWLGVIGG